MRDLIRTARPGHWIKNAIILFPVIFAMRWADANAWVQAGLATAAFCLVSSACYVVNDIHDRFRDAMHPRKKNRPLASGRLGVGRAWAFSVILVVAGLAVGAAVSVPTLIIVAVYLLLQTLYSWFLKHRVLLDVIGIALGFVVRAVAGAVAINVEISPWLFVCTFTLCLFMGFCKRYNEIVTIGEPEQAAAHRPTLARYSSDLLTHLITVSAGVAVVAFLLYATSVRTVKQFHTSMLVYTLPLVFYGTFRFAMLSMSGRYSDPTELLLRDRPLQLTLVLWLAAAAGILKWADSLPPWLSGM